MLQWHKVCLLRWGMSIIHSHYIFLWDPIFDSLCSCLLCNLIQSHQHMSSLSIFSIFHRRLKIHCFLCYMFHLCKFYLLCLGKCTLSNLDTFRLCLKFGFRDRNHFYKPFQSHQDMCSLHISCIFHQYQGIRAELHYNSQKYRIFKTHQRSWTLHIFCICHFSPISGSQCKCL